MYLDYDFQKPLLILDDERNMLLPLSLMVDFKESKIDLIPAVELVSEAITGVDGEQVYSSKFLPRAFDLVCYTNDNLDSIGRRKQEAMIGLYIEQLKKQACTMLYRGLIYLVRYNNNLDVSNYGHYSKITLPLKAYDCYGYSQVLSTVKKSTSVSYNGNIKSGVEIVFTGSVTSPFVTINAHKVSYEGLIPQNSKVIINTEKRTGTMISHDGIKSNAFGGISGLDNPVFLYPSEHIENNELIDTKLNNSILLNNPANTVIRWREKYI